MPPDGHPWKRWEDQSIRIRLHGGPHQGPQSAIGGVRWNYRRALWAAVYGGREWPPVAQRRCGGNAGKRWDATRLVQPDQSHRRRSFNRALRPKLRPHQLCRIYVASWLTARISHDAIDRHVAELRCAAISRNPRWRSATCSRRVRMEAGQAVAPAASRPTDRGRIIVAIQRA